jgi:4-oxalocrotonate tautomerase
MPTIRVEMFKGRSCDQKRAVARALTEDFVGVVGGKLESVTIVSKMSRRRIGPWVVR